VTAHRLGRRKVDKGGVRVRAAQPQTSLAVDSSINFERRGPGHASAAPCPTPFVGWNAGVARSERIRPRDSHGQLATRPSPPTSKRLVRSIGCSGLRHEGLICVNDFTSARPALGRGCCAWETLASFSERRLPWAATPWGDADPPWPRKNCPCDGGCRTCGSLIGIAGGVAPKAAQPIQWLSSHRRSRAIGNVRPSVIGSRRAGVRGVPRKTN
jgi:hypothetical protein